MSNLWHKTDKDPNRLFWFLFSSVKKINIDARSRFPDANWLDLDGDICIEHISNLVALLLHVCLLVHFLWAVHTKNSYCDVRYNSSVGGIHTSSHANVSCNAVWYKLLLARWVWRCIKPWWSRCIRLTCNLQCLPPCWMSECCQLGVTSCKFRQILIGCQCLYMVHQNCPERDAWEIVRHSLCCCCVTSYIYSFSSWCGLALRWWNFFFAKYMSLSFWIAHPRVKR